MKILQLVGPANHLSRNAEHNHLFLSRCGVDSEISCAAPGRLLLRAIEDADPDVVVFRANWCPLSAMAQAVARFQDTRFLISNHSSVYQLYRQKEWNWFVEALDLFAGNPRVRVTCVDRATATWLESFNQGAAVLHLPNFYFMDRVYTGPPPDRPGELHVGCFFVLREQKNLPNIVAALCILQSRAGQSRSPYRVVAHHVTRPGQYAQHAAEYTWAFRPLVAAGGSYVNDGWSDAAEVHARLCRQMDVHLLPAWSESYCYAAGDAIVNGRPFVGSPTIPWLPGSWRVTNPADAREIAGALEMARYWDVRVGLAALREYNRGAGVRSLIEYGVCSGPDEARALLNDRVPEMI